MIVINIIIFLIASHLFKDIHANCLCTSLLRTQFVSQCHTILCIVHESWERNIDKYSGGGYCNIYKHTKLT